MIRLSVFTCSSRTKGRANQVPKEELAAEIAKEKTKPRKKQAAKRKKKS